jgi:hypothetical protein
MKKTLMLLVAAAVLTGCATRSFDTFEARSGDYNTEGIALAPMGLTAEQIKTILNTKFPKKDRVSVALFFMAGDRWSSLEDLKENLVRGLKKSVAVERVVPVPPFIIPRAVTLEAVQQVGVRTLSEYSVLILGNSRTSATWEKVAEGKYTFHSEVDFMLVDNETTAIIAADKLMSDIDVPIRIFSDAEYIKARQLLFEEQEKAITDKMNQLFGK